MKRVYNSFKIACSMYSKIPMPRSDWSKENMRYAMCFFPWIGIVIGVLMYGWCMLNVYLRGVGITCSREFVTVIYLIIPVAITGGIHLDGLLDTADAISSYQSRERRLEILEDSHAGAFAIMICVLYFVLGYGVFSMVDMDTIGIIGIGFVLSRTLSALAIVSFSMAKDTGLAATFADGAQKRTVRSVMLVYLVVLAVLAYFIGGILGIAMFLSAGVLYLYYYRMSKKNFGGITGDLAGYFLQICELGIAFIVVLVHAVLT